MQNTYLWSDKLLMHNFFSLNYYKGAIREDSTFNFYSLPYRVTLHSVQVFKNKNKRARMLT